MECPLCDSFLKIQIDTYFFKCETCLAYVKSSQFYLTPSQEKHRYQQHNNDVNDINYQNFTSPITNSIIKNHTKNQIGLDFGCGTGPVISKQLTDMGYNIKLYDPFFYPDKDYLNYQYHFIFSCEVFEHLQQPKSEINNLVKILHHKGKMYVMTHFYQTSINFKNWYYRNDPTHVFIYTQQTMAFIAKAFNLKINKITDRLVIFEKL